MDTEFWLSCHCHWPGYVGYYRAIVSFGVDACDTATSAKLRCLHHFRDLHIFAATREFAQRHFGNVNHILLLTCDICYDLSSRRPRLNQSN